MLEAYSTNQTLAQNDIFSFNSTSLVKGKTTILSGVSSIELNCKGVYEVTLDISGTPSEAGEAKVTMTKNGVPQPQATLIFPLVATTVSIASSKTTLVQVPANNGPCCSASPVTIQFVNSGVGLIDANAHIVITKVC